MALEIHLGPIRLGNWGSSAGTALPAQLDTRLGIAGGATGPPALIRVRRGDEATYWELQPDRGVGVSRSGYQLRLNLDGWVVSTVLRTKRMFYGFAELPDWRAFQHLDQSRKSLKAVDGTHPDRVIL